MRKCKWQLKTINVSMCGLIIEDNPIVDPSAFNELHLPNFVWLSLEFDTNILPYENYGWVGKIESAIIK